MKEAVILVHGIWMNGLEMWRLRQFLASANYDCYQFKYPSLKNSPGENAALLNDFVQSIDAPVKHFVCHSLGGLVVLHLFDQFAFQKPGRIVFLGAPVNGSAVAYRLNSTRFTRWALGKSTDHGLLGDRPVWLKSRDLGVIAGTLPIGIGLVVGGLEAPHDGTVSVEETYLGGATDMITHPASHLGLLYSREVATQVVTFLRAGKFGDEVTNLLFDATG
ncbi:MAG: alpha/beta fold hydrolase [Gammaproteobacteria bacterium]|nr:alpha/beta fold hydrolase [Gammaproteobacteria bacterium]MDH5734808.1 alpha/beta fold hydrolase [Gammaproteobacteria bacterium]